jgi:hypothetical protein
MSENSNQPTREQIREARHAGFNDSVSHMDQERRDRLTQSFQTQDGRREANVSSFVSTVTGRGD